MSTESEQIEADIYEAAIIPGLWGRTLQNIADVADGDAGVLFTIGGEGVRWTSSPAVLDIMGRFVEEGWIARNSRGSGVVSRGLVGVPRFLTEEDYFDPGQFDTDPLVNEFLRPEGFGWAAGTLVALPAGNMFTLTVEKRYDRGPVVGAGLSRLNQLRPHIARAATLATELALAELRTAVEMLNAIGLPAAAITSKGQVVLCNARFETEERDWTIRSGDRLSLADKLANAELARTLQALATTGGKRSIPLRQDDLPVAVVQVLPIRRAAHDYFGQGAAIIIVNRVDTPADPALLQTMFDLTRSEAAVVASIADGLRLDEIAAANGTAVSTVRNQLKDAMSKTGLHRQVDLVRFISRIALK